MPDGGDSLDSQDLGNPAAKPPGYWKRFRGALAPCCRCFVNRRKKERVVPILKTPKLRKSHSRRSDARPEKVQIRMSLVEEHQLTPTMVEPAYPKPSLPKRKKLLAAANEIGDLMTFNRIEVETEPLGDLKRRRKPVKFLLCQVRHSPEEKARQEREIQERLAKIEMLLQTIDEEYPLSPSSSGMLRRGEMNDSIILLKEHADDKSKYRMSRQLGISDSRRSDRLGSPVLSAGRSPTTEKHRKRRANSSQQSVQHRVQSSSKSPDRLTSPPARAGGRTRETVDSHQAGRRSSHRAGSPSRRAPRCREKSRPPESSPSGSPTSRVRSTLHQRSSSPASQSDRKRTESRSRRRDRFDGSTYDEDASDISSSDD